MSSQVEITNTDPILTKEISSYRESGRNDSFAGLSVASSPSRTAQETIRQVLGWRYRGEDTKGFLAALNRAFDLKEVSGRTEWEWKPQNYMVQADLGEITGAQASIFTRAKVAVEHALPLLDGLVPLCNNADKEEMESIRALIRNAINEILREFGSMRGPRVSRVDGYFDQLLGVGPFRIDEDALKNIEEQVCNILNKSEKMSDEHREMFQNLSNCLNGIKHNRLGLQGGVKQLCFFPIKTLRAECSDTDNDLSKAIENLYDDVNDLHNSSLNPLSPKEVQGYLGELLKIYGLKPRRVNTIAEEQNLTNAYILVDYVITLQQTWEANRGYFDRSDSKEAFLGTQLVLLSQALETVVESVREVYDAMDSVFLGAVERQTTDIPFAKEGGQNTSPLTIAELLGWVEEFASVEARQLIQDAGKKGVQAVSLTLEKLANYVIAAQDASKEGGNVSSRFKSYRVQKALEELGMQLEAASKLAYRVNNTDSTGK